MSDGERSQLRPLTAPEALLYCPICQSGLDGNDYELHLRQVHHLFGYRGVRRSFDDTVEAMLDDLLSLPPFAIAWPALLRLLHEVNLPNIESFLAGRLGAALRKRPRDLRGKLVPDLAALIAPGNAPLVVALSLDTKKVSRLLALAALAVLPPPLDPLLLRPLHSLLLIRRLPDEMQIAALAAILPGISDERLAQELITEAIAGHGKAHSLKLLRQLEKRIGASAPLSAVGERLKERVRMSCPRCGVQMRRPAMMQHLWDKHRLILDNLRVRDPWYFVEEWLEAYKARHEPEMIERCRIAAAKIDPDVGPARLDRLMLIHEVADAETRTAALAEAREQHAGCCPWCWALVPVPREGPLPHINFRPGRLSARGYNVEINDRGLFTSLEVRTPTEVIWHGREPDRRFTSRGLAFLASGPLVLIAFLFALVWPTPTQLPIPVVLGLSLAAVVYAVMRLMGPTREALSRRVLDHTWRFLVPRLHEKGFVAEDSAFLAGLARLHGRMGKNAVVRKELSRLIRLTEPAVKNGDVPPNQLAALCRLEIECAADAEEDPIPRVVGWLTRCFDGRLPLTFAQRLLEEWVTSWWTKGNLARLRILLCDQAFEAGFEVRTLLEAGQNAPALGTVLRTAAPLPLAALRLLWSQRPTRPWDRLGETRTAFELAADPGYTTDLAEQPDVLLWREDPQFALITEDGRDPVATARHPADARGRVAARSAVPRPSARRRSAIALVGMPAKPGPAQFPLVDGPRPADPTAGTLVPFRLP